MNSPASLPTNHLDRVIDLSWGFLQQLLDASTNGMVVYEAARANGPTTAITDFRLVMVNQTAAADTRRPVAELVGCSLKTTLPGLATTDLYNRLLEVFETAEPARFTFALNHPSPTQTRYFDTSLTKIGQVVVSSYTDVTQLKQTQEHLERQNDEFRQVLDNALSSISHFTSVRDEQGKIIDFTYRSINKPAERMLGQTAEDVIGRTILDLLPGTRDSGLFDRWVAIVETQESERFQDRYQFDGFDFWYDMQVVALNDGFVRSYVDITPIKQAQWVQQQQAELLNSLLLVTPVAFLQYVANRDEENQLIDFELVIANQAAADVLGWPLAELTGQRLTALSPRVQNSPVYAHYVQVLETGEPAQFERQFGEKWYQVSVVKFGDGFISASIDITESRLHRQQLEAMNQELLRSNDSLQQFAFVASHDLQEPLRKILAFGELLTTDYGPQLDTGAQDTIFRMKSAATRMSMLITDLLTYSRLSSERKPFQPVHLDQVLAEVLLDLDLRIGETQATIDQTSPLPIVAGDASQLRQLVQNLLINALKFQPVRPADDPTRPHVCIGCEQAMTDGRMWYTITVSDNGIGFDEKHSERIFQVFQRLHGKQAYAGTGVGLAICKRVVETHGGTLTATSQPGAGATFVIELPG